MRTCLPEGTGRSRWQPLGFVGFDEIPVVGRVLQFVPPSSKIVQSSESIIELIDHCPRHGEVPASGRGPQPLLSEEAVPI